MLTIPSDYAAGLLQHITLSAFTTSLILCRLLQLLPLLHCLPLQHCLCPFVLSETKDYSCSSTTWKISVLTVLEALMLASIGTHDLPYIYIFVQLLTGLQSRLPALSHEQFQH